MAVRPSFLLSDQDLNSSSRKELITRCTLALLEQRVACPNDGVLKDARKFLQSGDVDRNELLTRIDSEMRRVGSHLQRRILLLAVRDMVRNISPAFIIVLLGADPAGRAKGA